MIIIPENEELIDQPFKSEADLEAEAQLAQLEDLRGKANALLFDQMQLKLETAPYDARFPHQNQTKHCWQNYVDYQKCIRAKGDHYKPCEHFRWIYKIMCPPLWVGTLMVFWFVDF